MSEEKEPYINWACGNPPAHIYKVKTIITPPDGGEPMTAHGIIPMPIEHDSPTEGELFELAAEGLRVLAETKINETKENA